MLYYIDGMEVSAKEAKDYFIEGHSKTQNWKNRNGFPLLKTSAETLWKNRTSKTTQDVIFNISGIQESGGLEISEN